MPRRPGPPETPLAQYQKKRDFQGTPEPSGASTRGARKAKDLAFVIQKHWASRLHYDFRLELNGVLLSWAVPKGLSFDPEVKQMAIQVEDHPIDYGGFEGRIPKGEYGAGTVIVWDRGTWVPVGDAREGLAKGKLIFKLHGEKLAGLWELVRISKPASKQAQWLLFKKRGDAWARPTAEYDVISALPDSVVEKPLGPVETREMRGLAGNEVISTTTRAPDLNEAVQSALPAKFAPQLATLVAQPPATGQWIVENKFDGYRMLARFEGGKVVLVTRNGNDWTAKLAPLAAALETLEIDAGWLDGEIVVLNDVGLPDFNRLQNAIDNARSGDIRYFVFDLPYLSGRDLRRVPLVSRRAVLSELLLRHPHDSLAFSAAFEAAPAQMLKAACELGLEGLILKRADAPYVSGRSETWLKLKCQQRQEFVVLGFTDRTNAPAEVGALVLGYHLDGALRYAGSVGTGWNAATGRDLHSQLEKIEIASPAIDPATVKPGRWSKHPAGRQRWVKPKMIVEVAFSEWTPDGHVRHPTFRGVRLDKKASAITREKAMTVGDTTAAGNPAEVRRASSVIVTNPDRLIDPSTGFKKLQLVRYYESIAEYMLPHLKDRPVSLVRAPQGIAGELFFQKHVEVKMPGVKALDPALWPGHSALIAVDSIEALVSAAQMNTVEFHTWNSKTSRINEPDRVIFDLDPGEGVAWKYLQEAALLTRSLLVDLGLESWLKTSGGKGLHVVVPLSPKLDYEAVKRFSQALVQHMAKTIPQRFVARSGGTNRVGRIFIDYLRNGHAQTTAAAFSARARPGMGVSMPVSWEQLHELKNSAQWSIATAREYVSFQKIDPWSLYWKKKQTLLRAIKSLGV